MLAVAGALEAQSGRGTTRPARPRPQPSRSAQAVRVEYANVLLQAGRYREAAREFRRLLERDGDNVALTLGLIRALAWGGMPREAETELRTLAVRRPRDVVIDSLLRAVRESFAPRAEEAMRWVDERPAYVPYRLALARALVRERQATVAIAQYDTLWTLVRGTPLRGTVLREHAAAHAAAGHRAGGIALLRRVVADAPSDSGARRALAGALAADRQLAAAIAQYDTLLQWHGGAALLLERGRLRAWHRDYAGAEADLRASTGLAPSVEAYVLLGDVHRWRADYPAARAAYESAKALQPRDRTVARALGDLLREERPPIAFAPAQTDDAGWQLGGESVEDNTGFSYATASLRHGFATRWGAVASVGGEFRSMGQRDGAGRFLRRVNGYAADVGLSRTFTYGRLGARGGAALHEGVSPVPYASASAMGWYRAWAASAQVDAAPAYPSLLTLATLLPSDAGSGRPLSGQSATLTLAGPIGAADLAVSGQQTRLGDDNRRVTMQAYARYALGARWYGVYSGSVVRFAERSTAYWDPLSYIGHAAGVELASRRPRGFSYTLRLVPGVARARELVRTADLEPAGIRTQWVPQLSTGGEWSFRSTRWELSAALAYGRGRAGDYERFDSNVQVRLLP
jgi:tetratricopeptide (TPR) repeat protein